ncbi:hypothetical protein, partial [Micromonospora sp. b486]|uniref:hypothetical protein n=1 Tax=Micromonospora sp. b486 TaxID=3053986 RepID=UPI00259CF097
MTTTRWQEVPHDGESWAMNTKRQAEVVLQGAQQVDDLRLDGDVQRGDGSSATISFGFSARRGRCRCAGVARRRTRADTCCRAPGSARPVQQLLHPVFDAPVGGDAVDLQRHRHDPPDRVPGVQRRVRVLEDDLQIRRSPRSSPRP